MPRSVGVGDGADELAPLDGRALSVADGSRGVLDGGPADMVAKTVDDAAGAGAAVEVCVWVAGGDVDARDVHR